jgi:hypothetical protein
MKPSLARLRSLCPETEQELIAEHLSRLEYRYFQFFSENRIAEHLRVLGSLSSSVPVQILVHPREKDSLEITVLAFDYPGEFSLITGILAASGFNIISGEVYTYSRHRPASGKRGAPSSRRSTFASRMRKSRSIRSDPLHRRRNRPPGPGGLGDTAEEQSERDDCSSGTGGGGIHAAGPAAGQ